MLNVLRMDFRRFYQNKMTALLLLIYCAFQMFGIFMMSQYRESIEINGFSYDAMNESEFFQYMVAQPPSWMLLYLAVFTVYFYMSEWNTGFYRNYISIRHARLNTVLSKILMLALFTLLLFLVTIFANLLGRQLFFGQVNIGDLGYFLMLLFGQYLLHWAFSVLMLYMTVITRNLIAALIIGLILAFNVPGMALAALESLFGGTKLSQYWIVNTIISPADYHLMDDVLRTVLVSVGFILIFAIAAIRYKKREDLP